MENSKLIESFLNFLHNVESDCKAAQDMQAEEDRKTQDILHMIELDELTYAEKGRLMKRLETVRRDRRMYKDSVEELTEIVAFAKENKQFIHKMQALLGKVRSAEKKHKNRMYIPRTNICDGVRIVKVEEQAPKQLVPEETTVEQVEPKQVKSTQAESVQMESETTASEQTEIESSHNENEKTMQDNAIPIPYITTPVNDSLLVDAVRSVAVQQVLTEVGMP